MRRLTHFALLALPLALVACARTATFDEAAGVPEATRWSYFQGTPEEVADALRTVLTLNGYTIDAISSGEGGREFVRVTTGTPGSDLADIMIEPVDVNGYTARAQRVPQRRPLPREIELAVSRQL